MVLAGVDGLGPVRVNGGGNTCTNKIEHYNTIEETSTFLLFPAPLLFIIYVQVDRYELTYMGMVVNDSLG